MTYDTNSYIVTVEVTDNGDGTLSTQVSSNGSALDFTNTYEASGSYPIQAEKELTGRTGKGLEAGEFSFELTAKDGAPMP